MRMPKDLFNELCEAIDKVMEAHSLANITNHRNTVTYVKSQFIAFCWSVFFASKFDVMKLYNAGLNDAHIETALKRILSDFE